MVILLYIHFVCRITDLEPRMCAGIGLYILFLLLMNYFFLSNT